MYNEREEMSFQRKIDKVEISDVVRRRNYKVGVHGLSPMQPDTMEHEFIKISS